MLAACILAKNAVKIGLKMKHLNKTILSTRSREATKHFELAGVPD